MAELFVSTDIEADGPIPGPYSMLSFASAAFSPDKTLVSTFSANLDQLAEAGTDPDTMAWWAKQPDAWAAHRQNTVDPAVAMQEYLAWLKALPGKPIFVGYPAGFDFTFVYWYLIKFTGESPFSFSALDIKSYAMAALKSKSYRSVCKRKMPAHWFPETNKHTHIALEDAIEQGLLFCTIMQEVLNDRL